MPPRNRKRAQRQVEEVKNELRGLNQDPFQQLVKLVVRAYEEGINEGRKSPMKNEKIEAEISSTKEEVANHPIKLKEVQPEIESSSSGRNFKRKWKNDKYEPEGSQSKKVKAYACINCGRKHMGICLKGKGVCFNCKQKGHISSQCPKPRKGGCFECGAYGHQVKKCPKKKEEVRGSMYPTHQFDN